MKLLFLGFLLLSCKHETKNIENHPPSDSSSEQSEAKFDNLWLFPNSGYMEIIRLANGSYGVYGTPRLPSKNADSTAVLLPTLPAIAFLSLDITIEGNYSPTYGVTNNVKRSSDNTAISGARLTYYTLTIVDGKLHIQYDVYSSNGLTIECTLNVVSE